MEWNGNCLARFSLAWMLFSLIECVVVRPSCRLPLLNGYNGAVKKKKTQSRQPVFVDTANCCSLGAACLLNFFLGALFGYFVFRCSVICSFFGCFVLFLDKNKYLILHIIGCLWMSSRRLLTILLIWSGSISRYLSLPYDSDLKNVGRNLT